MSPLERALKELEIATAALAEIPLANAELARAVLNQRSAAIARLAELTKAALAPMVREDALRRLRHVTDLGDLTQQRLAKATREAITEWSQWNEIYRGLGGAVRPDPKKIDCLG